MWLRQEEEFLDSIQEHVLWQLQQQTHFDAILCKTSFSKTYFVAFVHHLVYHRVFYISTEKTIKKCIHRNYHHTSTNSMMKSCALAILAALMISSSVASNFPKRIFSSIVPEKSVGS